MLVTAAACIVVAEFVTTKFTLKINIMRNENMNEPQNPQCVQTSVMVSADLYDEIFLFIDSVRACTMNKQTFDEALVILKKMIDAKV